MADKPRNTLPFWRGFNLLEMFNVNRQGPWQEEDFKWIAEWGFNFVRFPMSYLLWVKEDPFKLDETGMARVDAGIALAQRYGLHVELNFHNAPGYCVSREKDPFGLSLFHDPRSQDAFCFHWQTFARRYRGIPSSQLSFNLVNEPPNHEEHRVKRSDHDRVMHAAIDAIRAEDPDRLIILDGMSWGNEALPQFAGLANVAQSCRAYAPMHLTHYKATWVDSSGWPEPDWPKPDDRTDLYDRDRLVNKIYAPWGELVRQGVGVHCGEGGSHCHTPHRVVLAWLSDVLDILASYNVGLALWNFRGPFGVLDSDRADVDYEDFCGHTLDRKLLDLLQSAAPASC